MSESLRDSAISSFNEALELMQKGQNKEALKALEKAEKAVKFLLMDPENEFFQSNLQKDFDDVFTLGISYTIWGVSPKHKISMNCFS